MTDAPPDWSDFYARLRRFVAARVGNQADADDLVQLVLERAIARSAGAEPIENTMAWLFAIARNTIADHYRAQARGLSAAAQLDEEARSPPPTEDGRREVLACMEPLLRGLDPEAQQVVRWADVEGRSMQSIATELGLSVSGAKSRVQRARQELLRKLLRCCSVTLDTRGRATDLQPKRPGACLGCGPESSPGVDRKPS